MNPSSAQPPWPLGKIGAHPDMVPELEMLEQERALRAELEAAAERPGAIWPPLMARFPDPKVREALSLAYELGHEEGNRSAMADMHEDNPDAVKLAREICGHGGNP